MTMKVQAAGAGERERGPAKASGRKQLRKKTGKIVSKGKQRGGKHTGTGLTTHL